MIKVVVDINGGDNEPSLMIKGILQAINENKDLKVIIAGQEEVILDVLKNENYSQDQIEILPAEDIVTNYDMPAMVLKQKPNSSLVKGMRYLKEHDDASGIVCIGNTGAVLASAMFVVGRINHCRPTLATLLPNAVGGYMILADCGANVDTSEEQLLNFAKMGVTYAKATGISSPKVGLLSNGKEDKKGNEVTKNANALLRESNLNFVGNIEGSNALSGECDVLVSDGFAGNILLKNIEGVAKTIIKEMYIQLKEAKSEEEAKVIKNLIDKIMAKYNFNDLGGAILLGVNKIVVKGHGAATDKTIVSTLKMVYDLSKNNLIENMKNILEG